MVVSIVQQGGHPYFDGQVYNIDIILVTNTLTFQERLKNKVWCKSPNFSTMFGY